MRKVLEPSCLSKENYDNYNMEEAAAALAKISEVCLASRPGRKMRGNIVKRKMGR